MNPAAAESLARARAKVAAAAPASDCEFQSLADVEPENPTWLWDKKLALGKIGLIAGRPGLGKTTFAAWLAARISRGELEGDLYGEPRSVLFASAEDGLADTIVPRAMAAGADLDLIHVPGRLLTVPVDISAFVKWAEAAEVKPALIVIDPLMAFLGGDTNAHRDQDVRKALAPVAEFAEAYEIAVLTLLHFNKGQGTDALERIGGSIGITGAARHAFAFGVPTGGSEDAEDDGTRVLASVKQNLARKAKARVYRITETKHPRPGGGEPLDTTRIEYVGESDLTADDLLSHPDAETRARLAEAVEFLEAELAVGPRESNEIVREARGQGISESTLKRARSQCGVKSRRVEGFGKAGKWMMELPDPAAAQNGGPKVSDEERERRVQDHVERYHSQESGPATLDEPAPPADDDLEQTLRAAALGREGRS
ncbi:MAG: putative primase/helicase [Thermoleophilaceae bacterium]|nr:putative primase/helicase [Thermoleophilaceae bacterium]